MKKTTKLVMANAVDKIQHWDTHWCIRINSYSTKKQIALFFKYVSRAGDGMFWFSMLGLALLVEGMQALAPVLLTMVTSFLGLMIYKKLKHKTVRPRPYQVHQVIILGERPLDHFSFPSGHTLHAVLFTATLGAFFPYLLFIMVPFMILVAISRMVLGLHYPTDVFMGALIGLSLSVTAIKVSPYLFG